ncbi:MAG: RNA methyltransferase [Ruminococcaceae bacterium]|nr:RNA methyltransferase [Oscillospiraceae bacterium]
MAEIIRINSIDDPRVREYLSLKCSKKALDGGCFIAEGEKVIRLALELGLEPVSLLMEERQIVGLGKAVLSLADVPVYTSSREILSGITGFELTRGFLSLMRRPKMPSVDEVLEKAKRVAVLEGLSDGVNVGAIMRSAAALGIDAVLLYKNCCDPLNRRSVRVSMGTVLQIPWAYLELPLSEGVELLRSKGFLTVSLALKNDTVGIDDPVLTKAERLAMFFGSEGNGLDERIVDNCDYTAKIPMYHGVDSLNVAAAAAVSFWEIAKRA